jgi:hypothetical protein
MLQFKRETTWLANVTYTPPEGAVPNLIGYTIASSFRTSDQKTHPFTVILAIDGLSFTVSASSEITSQFSLGQGNWDIRFFNGGSVTYTETYPIQIVQQITQ